MSDTVSNTVERLTGRVKWFNNRSGFGFITVTSGSRSGQDIFVHYTSLNVASKQYMYLVQGEYVEFELAKMEEGAQHEHQALSVTGVNGGVLMCETRLQNPRPRRYVRRDSRNTRTSPDDRDDREYHPERRNEDVPPPRSVNRRRGDRRTGPAEGNEFQYVTRRRRVV
jgi:cold shock CspA family protein